MKVGDLVAIPELDANGEVLDGKDYCFNAAYMNSDGSWTDPGPLMIMKTAITNEGKQLVMVHLAADIEEWDPDDPNNHWDYVDQFGYRLVSTS